MSTPRMASRSVRTIVALAVVLITCDTAQANPGMALFFRTTSVLILGNAILALAEFAIARAFGCAKSSLKFFLLANYLSSWVGVLVLTVTDLPWLIASEQPSPVRAMLIGSGVLIGSLIAITVAIELPFFWLALSKTQYRASGKVWRFGAAFVSAHVVSYSALILFFADRPNFRLLTDYRWVATPSQVVASDNTAQIYYIGLDNTSVWRAGIGGQEPTCIATDLPLTRTRLMAMPNSDGRFSLAIIGEDLAAFPGHSPANSSGLEHPYAVLIADIGEAASIFMPDRPQSRWETGPASMKEARLREKRYFLEFGDAADLRDASVSAPAFRWDSDAFGIRRNGTTGRRMIGLYDGLLQRGCHEWFVSALPDEVIVWEMFYAPGFLHAFDETAPRAIYVLSEKSKSIARLAFGRSPIVAFESAPDGWVNPLAAFEDR